MKPKSIEGVIYTKDNLREAAKEKIWNALNIFENKWIELQECWYSTKWSLIIAKLTKYPNAANSYPSDLLGIPTRFFTFSEALDLFMGDSTIDLSKSKKYNNVSYITCTLRDEEGALSQSTGGFCSWGNADSDKLRIASAEMSHKYLLKNLLSGVLHLSDSSLSEQLLPKLVIIMNAFTEQNVEFTDENSLEEMPVTVLLELAGQLGLETDTMDEESFEAFQEEIITQDYCRAELECDDQQWLHDVNMGHWALWKYVGREASDNEYFVCFPEPLVARDPISDVRYDCIAGIDFGTRSTVVSCQDGGEHTVLVRVGTGDYSSELSAEQYENPTFMEFVDICSFLESYRASEGRPLTHFEDLKTAHQAVEDFAACHDSENYYSFFSGIKQWCARGNKGSEDSRINIIDHQNYRCQLEPYLELSELDIDPVELYAYYLGLHINNMRRKICLVYYLSFPVTYKKAVRDRIRLSFERGLKKSLPNEVLENEEVMKRFRVVLSVSEPAAYAVCALENYGFEPVGDEKIYYGVFDFGGGTSDFDFGIWRESDPENEEEEDYDYVISHFGDAGDQYLGGENLLELMAYRVFLANLDALRNEIDDNNTTIIQFSRPEWEPESIGLEAYISPAQNALKNTKVLMEALRPIWEETVLGLNPEYSSVDDETADNAEGENSPYILNDSSILKDGSVTVELLDKDGEQVSVTLALETENLNLISLMEERIQRGVQSFFSAAEQSFHDVIGREKIYIFLAGNSSRSPILMHCFEEEIRHITTRYDRSYEMEPTACFEVFPSLGTEEAHKKQSERGLEPELGIVTPTGKTGVAYGLLRCRPSGRIKVVSETTAKSESRFRYIIGKEKKQHFVPIAPHLDYRVWIPFGKVRDGQFELYYTTRPDATKYALGIDEECILRSHCLIDAEEGTQIYIRAVAPDQLEYVAAPKGKTDLNESEYLSEIGSVLLK